MARLALQRGALAGVVAGTALALAPAALATFPGENGAIAFQRSGDIFTVQPDGSGERQLTSGPAQDGHPDWSPDGRELLFERDGDVWRMAADGTGSTKLVEDGQTPDWFRDGRIVFSRSEPFSEQRELYSADRDGGGVARVNEGFERSHAPDPAPTSDLILTHFVGDNGERILRADSPGSTKIDFNLDQDEYDSGDGSWAPDGHSVAFSRGTGPVFAGDIDTDPLLGVVVMDIAGVEARTIVQGGTDPAWSPDGKRIAYVNRDGETLQVVRADGEGRRTIAKGLEPDWQALASKPPEPEVRIVPGPERVVTVPVEVPGPERVVEKVVTRTVQGEKCVIPAGKRKLTLVIRATRAIKAGAGVRITVDLSKGKPKVKVPRGKPIRAGAR